VIKVSRRWAIRKQCQCVFWDFLLHIFYFIIHCYLYSFLSLSVTRKKTQILSIHAASAKMREIFKVNFAVHFNTFSFHPLACPLYKFNLIDCYMFFSCSLGCVDECFVQVLCGLCWYWDSLGVWEVIGLLLGIIRVILDIT